MQKTAFVWWVLLLLAARVSAQSLTGTVRDAGTSEPVAFATVFLNNTAWQTETDSAGRFALPKAPTGTYTLVVRLLGYRASAQTVGLVSDKSVVLSIQLTPDPAQLAEVRVTARKDRQWAGQRQRFERQFLGEGRAAQSCRLLNAEVLTFTEQNGVLTARADKALEVDNPYLGYKIQYLLRSFRFDGSTVSYTGYAQFTPYLSPNRQQRDAWAANRQTAYEQSDIHFFAALRNLRTAADGYEAFVDKPGEDPTRRSPFFYQEQRKRLTAVALDSLVSVEKSGETYRLAVPRRLEIHHRNRAGETSLYKDKPVDVAWIETNGRPLRFDRYGRLLNPQDCALSGYLVNQRVAGMLPLDFGSTAAAPPNPPGSVARAGGYGQAETPFFTTDRPFYTGRDRILVSGILQYADPAGADSLSGLLHLELVDPRNRAVLVHQRVPIRNGQFRAQLSLNDSLQTPAYFLLRAYTNLMRTAGDSRYAFRWLPVLPAGQRFWSVPVADSLAGRFTLAERDTLLVVEPTASFARQLHWASLTVLAAADAAGPDLFTEPANEPDNERGKNRQVFGVERGIAVTGRVEKPRLTGGSVSLFAPVQQRAFFADVNSLGNFAFRDLPLTGRQAVLLTFSDATGKPVRSPVVTFDSLPVPAWLPPLPPAIDRRMLMADTVAHWTPDGRLLAEVVIKAKTPPKPIASIYKKPDYTVPGSELFDKAVGTNILTALQGRVPGINLVEFPDEFGISKLVLTMRAGNSARGFLKGPPPQPLVLVDGVPFDDVNQLSILPPSRVERVEVVNRAESLLGLRGYVGVISIITKNASGVALLNEPVVANFARHTIDGFAPDPGPDPRDRPYFRAGFDLSKQTVEIPTRLLVRPCILVIEGVTNAGERFRLRKSLD